jgi:polar amino acid transport system substrate-binding protein
VALKGDNAKNVAEKCGFQNASTDPNDILHKESINVLFIATQHDSHSKYVVEGLKQNKNVFVEKPLALNEADLLQVIEAYNSIESAFLMVGFNRRFAPLAIKAKHEFSNIGQPLVIQYRINAGTIPSDHWIQDEAIGGGRVIGEVCHFVDFLQYITGALPERIFAESIEYQSNKRNTNDTLVISIKFCDGSVGTITYVATGNKQLAKERIEIFGGEKSFVIDDFKKGFLYKNNKCEVFKERGKGHKEEIQEFLKCIKAGSPSPISFESLCYTTLSTFKIIDSIRTGLPQKLIV